MELNMSDTTTPPSPSDSILSRITSSIETAQRDGYIADAVVKVFADREETRRVKLLTEGLDLLKTLTKTYNDVNKPDDIMYSDVEKKVPVEHYSSKKIDEINKAKKAVTNLTKAIDEALAKGQYENLEKALKNKGGEPKEA